MHRMLLREYFGGLKFNSDKDLPLQETVSEMPQEGAPFTVIGIIQRADKKNQNGRIYPYSVLKKECDRYMDLISQKTSFGELDHADDQVIALKNSSHIIEDLWWDGPEKKEVWGKIRLLNTPAGQIAKGIVMDGIPLGISSRAVGSIERNNSLDADVVQDDLQIIGWDIVGTPSTHAAFLRPQGEKKPHIAVAESKIITTRDKIKETLKELLKKQ